MQTEEHCKPSERYLFADEYFSDNAISIWKSECIKRCIDKPKGEAYNKYINWSKNDGEIAIFTLYAYADFKIPKKFDIIFQTNEPSNFININYELTQSIYEAWFPLDSIEHGHKHLCIFQFDKEIPPILNLLHCQDDKQSRSSKGQIKLGFCNSSDFISIQERIEKTLSLKEKYGDKWYEYDNGK